MDRRTARITIAPYTPGAQGLWLDLRRRLNSPSLAQAFWHFGTPITPHKEFLSDEAARLGLQLLDFSGKTLEPRTAESPQEAQAA
jgi:hypothetical protein